MSSRWFISENKVIPWLLITTGIVWALWGHLMGIFWVAFVFVKWAYGVNSKSRNRSEVEGTFRHFWPNAFERSHVAVRSSALVFQRAWWRSEWRFHKDCKWSVDEVKRIEIEEEFLLSIPQRAPWISWVFREYRHTEAIPRTNRSSPERNSNVANKSYLWIQNRCRMEQNVKQQQQQNSKHE